jgi:hypothetical protein
MDVLNLKRFAAPHGLSGSLMRACAMVVVTLIASTNWQSPAKAQSEGLAEYEVKAAFLFNFSKFVDWPESSFADARAPIVLGIVGDNPFGDDLRNIVNGQVVKGRSIRVSTFRFGDDLRACQIIFVGASERGHTLQILASLRGADVLTVSDIDGFAKVGGVMQFVVEQGRVRFLVNLEAASQTKLRINSKLLALARVINRTDP